MERGHDPTVERVLIDQVHRGDTVALAALIEEHLGIADARATIHREGPHLLITLLSAALPPRDRTVHWLAKILPKLQVPDLARVTVQGGTAEGAIAWSADFEMAPTPLASPPPPPPPPPTAAIAPKPTGAPEDLGEPIASAPALEQQPETPAPSAAPAPPPPIAPGLAMAGDIVTATAIIGKQPHYQELKKLAQNGNTLALGQILTHAVQHKGWSVGALETGERQLRLTVRGEAAPDREVALTLLERKLQVLQLPQFGLALIEGVALTGEAAWQETVDLTTLPPPQAVVTTPLVVGGAPGVTPQVVPGVAPGELPSPPPISDGAPAIAPRSPQAIGPTPTAPPAPAPPPPLPFPRAMATVFKGALLDPAGTLADRVGRLGPGQAWSVGLVAILLNSGLLLLAMVILVQSATGRMVLPPIPPSTIAVNLLLTSAVPVLGLTLANAIARPLFRGRGGSLGTDFLIAAIAVLPWGCAIMALVALLPGLLGSDPMGRAALAMAVAWVIGTLALCHSILVLYAGQVKLARIPSRFATLTITLAFMGSVALSQGVITLLFQPSGPPAS